MINSKRIQRLLDLGKKSHVGDRKSINFPFLEGKSDSSIEDYRLAGINSIQDAAKSSKSEPFFSSINENLIVSRSLRFGLEPMRRLDLALSSPSTAFPSVIVAGTNGKGSVTTKIASSIALKGKKVGLYTSPHIATLRERISINGEMIQEERVDQLLTKLFDLIDQENFDVSFFELMTALGFLYFAEEKVDLAVLEVGMGGRLDATNIVTPLLSIVTSIDLDHTLYLGSTLEAIATEKAGIIKPKAPVLVGPKARQFSVFKETAAEKKSPFFEVDKAFENFEEENRAVASAALDLLHFPYDPVGLLITPPCRFELHEKEIPILMDVAHNPGAFSALFHRIHSVFGNKKVALLLAFSSDKEIDVSLEILKRQVDFFFLTKGPTSRAEDPQRLAERLKKRGVDAFDVDEEIGVALFKARKWAHENGALLVVTGTFYIMAEVRRHLGILECRDPVLSKY